MVVDDGLGGLTLFLQDARTLGMSISQNLVLLLHNAMRLLDLMRDRLVHLVDDVEDFLFVNHRPVRHGQTSGGL